MKVSEAALKLQIPRHYVYYWKRTGLLSGAEDLDFLDLRRARLIFRWRQHGLSLQEIRRRIQELGADADWHRQMDLYGPGMLVSRGPAGLRQFGSGQALLPFEDEPTESTIVSLPARRESGKRPVHSEDPAVSMLEQRYLDLLAGGDYRRIRKTLEEILELRPMHVAAHIEMGNLCHEFDRSDEALGHYERALELEPECVEALYNIANIHFKKKHYAVAIRYFQGCIQYEPDFPEAYYNLGLLYYSLSYLEPARACLEQYLELDPDSDWADQAREWLREIGGRLKNQAESRNFSLFAVDGPEGN